MVKFGKIHELPTKNELEYWNSQLQFSAILPDFDEQLKWMAENSKNIAQKLDLKRIKYGEHSRQWFEYINLTSGNNADVIKPIPVFIHGGYWRSMRAEDHRFILPCLTEINSVAINVEYRLMPEIRLGEVIEDIANAINALVDKFGAEQKFLLIGHSAGAHLALSAAKSKNIASHIAAIVAISGVFELDPLSKSFLQAELQLTTKELRDHNLMTSMPDIPTLLVIGGQETDLFRNQIERISLLFNIPVFNIPKTHHMNILRWLVIDADRSNFLSKIQEALMNISD